ncbi:sulfotransferase family protein [Actibacterium sp. D379-3]
MSFMSEIHISAAQAEDARQGSRRYAFVTGCARSGTTALTRLLNKHPDICIGFERFSKLHRRRELTPAHFEPGRFLDVDAGDTHYPELTGFRAFHARKIGQARVVGDKYPQLPNRYRSLFRAFPEARVVYILRDPFSIADSFERRAGNPDDGWADDRGYMAAIEEWNDSLKRTEAIAKKRPDQVGIFCFHDLMIAGTSLPRLYRFLGVDIPETDQRDDDVELTPPTEVNTALRKAVAETANFATYRRLLTQAAAQEKSFT